MHEVFDVIRYANLVLAAVSLVGTIRSVIWIWGKVPAEPRLSRCAVAMFSLSALYGTAEQMYLGIPSGPRTAVTTGALILATVACLLPNEYKLFPRDRTKPPTP